MHWYLEVMRKYAVFAGRAGREEYWMFQLVNAIVIVVLAVVCGLLIPSTMANRGGSLLVFVLVIILLYVLATLIPSLAVSVRRLHDKDLSGWWLLIGLVPLGGIIILVFHLLDSNPGPNQYGPNPKEINALPQGQNAYSPQMMAAAAGAVPASPGDQWFLGFCKSCGAQMQAGARFCPKCGIAAY